MGTFRLYKYLLVGVAFFLLIGCGYKPSSKFARQAVGEKVSTSVVVSARDPENTVVIKDAVDTAVIEIFRASLVPKGEGDSHLTIRMNNPSIAPIQYDQNGFIIAYRMTIVLNVTRTTAGVNKQYTARGTYDFTVEANAVVTDTQRFNAIRFSAQKAIASFVAQMSAEGARSKHNEAQRESIQ